MSRENDRVLRLYHEVLELDHLHYGLWEPGEELNLPTLRIAQQRFEDYLVDHLPAEAQRILDVGVGTGSLTKRLLAAGKDCEGLSPDIHQKRKFAEEIEAPFHHCRYEDLGEVGQFDCVVMSESAQYVWFPEVVEKSAEIVKVGGYWGILDYFSIGDGSGVFEKSGHRESELVALAEKHGFAVVEREDVTERMLKSLDLARNLAERGLLAAEIFSERERLKRPRLTRFVKWLFRKKIEKAMRQMQLLDSAEWRKHREYLFLLLRKER